MPPDRAKKFFAADGMAADVVQAATNSTESTIVRPTKIPTGPLRPISLVEVEIRIATDESDLMMWTEG